VAFPARHCRIDTRPSRESNYRFLAAQNHAELLPVVGVLSGPIVTSTPTLHALPPQDDDKQCGSNHGLAGEGDQQRTKHGRHQTIVRWFVR
jgi:hypothetical protein